MHSFPSRKCNQYQRGWKKIWDRRQGLPRTYCVPFAITEQRRMRDLGPALAKVKHEVEAALMELERGIIHLVLICHVINKATGGKCPNVQLNLEPEREQEVRARDQEDQLPVLTTAASACVFSFSRERVHSLVCPFMAQRATV